jgi:hypothetical protein
MRRRRRGKDRTLHDTAKIETATEPPKCPRATVIT